jgi:hypothetical protein
VLRVRAEEGLVVLHVRYSGRSRIRVEEMDARGLFVDLGQELVVAEQRVLLFANLDGATAELWWC